MQDNNPTWCLIKQPLTMKERSARILQNDILIIKDWYYQVALDRKILFSSTFTLFVDYRMLHILIEFTDNRNSWEKKNMHQNMLV